MGRRLTRKMNGWEREKEGEEKEVDEEEEWQRLVEMMENEMENPACRFNTLLLIKKECLIPS